MQSHSDPQRPAATAGGPAVNPPTGAGPGERVAPVPDAMLETAAAWLARRREPPANPREAAAREAAFADWLDAFLSL